MLLLKLIPVSKKVPMNTMLDIWKRDNNLIRTFIINPCGAELIIEKIFTSVFCQLQCSAMLL